MQEKSPERTWQKFRRLPIFRRPAGGVAFPRSGLLFIRRVYNPDFLPASARDHARLGGPLPGAAGGEKKNTSPERQRREGNWGATACSQAVCGPRGGGRPP